jgi:DNA polymerase
VTHAERRSALEEIAAEVRSCTRCRLSAARTNAVPGEGNPSTEVMFVGEGPGFNEDRQGRPFVGRAGDLLIRLLASIGWRREDVFITNVVKCRPPDNRDPQPDEIAACAPFLHRQLEILDPALVVTLGRFSLGTFMPGSRIGQVHGTSRPIDPATGARDALALAMYHPAAALRTTAVERESFQDIARVPITLTESRRRRVEHDGLAASVSVAEPPSGTGYDSDSSSRRGPSVEGAPAGPVGAPSTLAGAESHEPASSPTPADGRSPVAVAPVAPPLVAPPVTPPPVNQSPVTQPLDAIPDSDQMTLF